MRSRNRSDSRCPGNWRRLVPVLAIALTSLWGGPATAQDCDGSDVTDVDGDAYDGGPDGLDCDDENADINPDADEACDDGVDNDCDGNIDEADDECSPADDDPEVLSGCQCRGRIDGSDRRAPLALLVVAALMTALRVGRRRSTTLARQQGMEGPP